jgi:exopolysaccharide biosynthesis polyprenyl glycosylphosphotransferase
MNTNGICEKHWFRVFQHFVLDTLAFAVSFLLGMRIRFAGEWLEALNSYWSGVLVGALVFSCACYIFGLYSLQSSNHKLFKRSFFIGISFVIAVVLMVGIFYLNFSTRIGRGAMLISGSITYLTVLIHHFFLLHELKNYRERVALIVTSAIDEQEVSVVNQFAGQHLDLVGVIHYDSYKPTGESRVLGSVAQLREIAQREKLERILCTNQSITDPALCQRFCQLRYSGITVMPLISLFEESFQCVPVELITPDWLMNASGSPHMLYIKKLKRGFDVLCSLAGLFFFWPFLLLGMLLIKVTSPRGPIFYRQLRCGRFGRTFEVLKLRTMCINAENGGAVWAARKNDPRVIPCGNFLRRYRIDEIPQLWNVLRGEMSFVGPRPERPEFVEALSKQIPFYRERLLVQPGITGWAQVRYPYGASVEDAKHKLEYDLYYAKNMSLFLDLFILLDTIRIILRGGLYQGQKRPILRSTGDTDWIPAPPQPTLPETTLVSPMTAATVVVQH